MSKANPKVGDRVNVLVQPKENGGSDVASADIVKVYTVGEGDDEKTFVNVKARLDADNDRWMRDLPLLDKRPEDDDEVEDATKADGLHRVAFWPASR